MIFFGLLAISSRPGDRVPLSACSVPSTLTHPGEPDTPHPSGRHSEPRLHAGNQATRQGWGGTGRGAEIQGGRRGGVGRE